MKYIDSEKLIVEIERLGRNWDGVQELQPASLFQADLHELLALIASLQQEQPEGWYNKAAKFWYEHCELNKTKDRRILILDAPTFTELVHDFYEIGLNARKEE